MLEISTELSLAQSPIRKLPDNAMNVVLLKIAIATAQMMTTKKKDGGLNCSPFYIFDVK